MSDFDKEAEREKLRKKFADDEEKRAGTRRMSELLLKGATMTNKHCGRCSDPLFRYDGQTFCPSCQADGAAVQDDEPQAQGDPAADPEVETKSEAPPETGGEPPQPETPRGETESMTPPAPSDAEPTQSPQPQRGQPQPQSTQPSQPQRGQFSQPGTASSVGEQHQKTQTQVGDLTDARQSLQRTVTRFAQAAEQTDDPRRARDLLAAAREAAATLSELD